MNVLLLSMLFVPLAAALVLMTGRGLFSQSGARRFALIISCITLLLSLAFANEFLQLPAQPRTSPIQPQYSVAYHWFTFQKTATEGAAPETLQFEFLFGFDAISLALLLLTTVLTVSGVLISWESIRERPAGFYACLLLLEAGLIGVFSASDLILFYVFFEFTLVPLFFLIGIWGGPERRYTAIKFFLYTFAGSMVTLVGLVALVMLASAAGVAHPTSFVDLSRWAMDHPLPKDVQVALFLAISVGFMVKVPVFPLHTWLPLAHTEAPTAGSVMLAGVLLKLGTYGILRFCLPLFPYACETIGIRLMGSLAVIGIIYGSLCALAQRDIKKLVAYSSVAHLGFCVLGLFALNEAGITGGVLQMINHGLSTGALFLLVGMVYDRYHTRQLDDLGGLASRLPLLTVIMVFVAMASIGLPGLNGFVGEVLSLGGMFRRNPLHAILATSGVVLGAWYLLTMVQQAFFGPLREPHHSGEPIHDINFREFVAVAPICALCLWIGVMPQMVIDTIKPDVDAVVAVYDEYLTSSERVAKVQGPATSEQVEQSTPASSPKTTSVTLDQPSTLSEL